MSSSEDLPVQIPDGFQPLGTSGTRLLEIERAKASFSPAELREYIYGNEYLERQARILPIVENEVRLGIPLLPAALLLRPSPLLWRLFAGQQSLTLPLSYLFCSSTTPPTRSPLVANAPPPTIFDIRQPAFDKSQIHYMSRGDKYRHGLKKEKRIVQLTREHGWSAEDVKVAEELIDMPAAFGLHNSMFLKTLRSQSNEEQQELFTKPAENFEIIGVRRPPLPSQAVNPLPAYSPSLTHTLFSATAVLRADGARPRLERPGPRDDGDVQARDQVVHHQHAGHVVDEVVDRWPRPHGRPCRRHGAAVHARRQERQARQARTLPLCRSPPGPQDARTPPRSHRHGHWPQGGLPHD